MAERSTAVTHNASAVEGEEPEDALIARVSAERRVGADRTDDVETLLQRAGERSKAALDRLAK